MEITNLIKIKFDDKTIVWSVPTGVAPYGICIIKIRLILLTGQALVTDTTRENAGTPWGSAYTDPRTGATDREAYQLLILQAARW